MSNGSRGRGTDGETDRQTERESYVETAEHSTDLKDEMAVRQDVTVTVNGKEEDIGFSSLSHLPCKAFRPAVACRFRFRFHFAELFASERRRPLPARGNAPAVVRTTSGIAVLATRSTLHDW